MQKLATALNTAINSGELPLQIEQKAKALLNDIAICLSSFVKDSNKWDDIKVRALRVDMAFNFATGRYFNVRKRNNIEDYRYSFYVYNYVSKDCAGCKFYSCKTFSKWYYEEARQYHYCDNPFAKCPKGLGRKDKAECALVRWLLLHEPILMKATKGYEKQLLYIAQNPTQRYRGICAELYKSIQNELIQSLINYKSFTTLCNQLTPNHC